MIKPAYLLIALAFFSFLSIFAREPRKIPSAKEKMRVLFVLQEFPKVNQQFIKNQITGLMNKVSLDVHLLLLCQTERKIVEAKVLGTKFGKLQNKIYLGRLPHEKNDFDVILCEFGTLADHVLTLKEKEILSGKLLVFYRGMDMTKLVQAPKEKQKKILRNVDLFLPVCCAFKEELLALGCDPKKILVLHSAIDCDFFAFRESLPKKSNVIRLLTVSRLVKKKGIEYGIYAVAKLMTSNKNVLYTIVGDGENLFKLKQLVLDLHVENSVLFLGECSQKKVRKLLQKTDIFLLPAVTASSGIKEGIPNCLKEAMAVGVPVISTFHSGIPELISPGRTGLLVEERNIEALMCSIEYLIEHPEICVKLTYQARKKIEKEYNKELENAKLEKICYSIVKNDLRCLKQLSW